MGCSVSRCNDSAIARQVQGTSSTSYSSNYSHSPFTHSSYPNSTSSTPVSRTFSLPTPLVHHPPLRRGDTNHLVTLTSTTYGSLVLLDHPNDLTTGRPFQRPKPDQSVQTTVPPSPDSVINTWELMEGLEGDDEDELGFHIVNSPKQEPPLARKPNFKNPNEQRRDLKSSLPKQFPSEESLLMELQEWKDAIRKTKVIPSTDSKKLSGDAFCLPNAQDRIVLYYTSLRGIRKTYEDCRQVRMILRGFNVVVDERDVSLDSSYRRELEDVFGGKRKQQASLPQVFVRGNHIGGADDVRRLDEAGELGKLMEGFPVVDGRLVCGSCGDARFVPCRSCNGSRKVFGEEEGRLRRCSGCNENGLVRCPGCCS